jgi:negative regulator of flagellin synthesis FlgM
MQIHGLGQVHGPQQIKAPHTPPASRSSEGPRSSGNIHIDQLDISPEADLVSRARESGDIRQDRVAELREQIASGKYETEEKLDMALSRLLDELA